MDGEECSLEVLIKSKLSRWCHDIGREQAANKPLLKTVFQVILFSVLLSTESADVCNACFIQTIFLSIAGHDAPIQSSQNNFVICHS